MSGDKFANGQYPKGFQSAAEARESEAELAAAIIEEQNARNGFTIPSEERPMEHYLKG